MASAFDLTLALHAHADTRPNALALVTEGEAVTYGQLAQAADRQAERLRKAGAGPGKRVLMLTPMSVGFYASLLGIWQTGAAAVVIDPWMGPGRVWHAFRTAGCCAVVAGRGASVFRLGNGAIGQTDEALITFTSGSTGLPKGAVRTPELLLAQAYILGGITALTQDDAALTHLPIVALLGLQAGSAVVIPPIPLRNLAGMDAHRVASLGLIHDANVLLCSPFVAQRLGETALSTRISRLVTGGSPVFPEDAAGLIRAFPNSSGTAIYGATEAEPVSAAPLVQLAQNQVDAMRGLWVGKAVREVGVRIQDLTSGAPLPPGQLGEIAVNGPHVLRRYLGQPERSPEAFHGMGDTGFLTPEGDLCLCGRASQAVFAHGQPVSSLYWEHRLRQLPGVTGAALVNHVGTAWAVIEAQNESQARSHLAHFQYFEDELAIPPARWKVVRRLPRDKRHNGKVLYEAVVRQLR